MTGVAQYTAALAGVMGIEPEVFDTPGVRIVPGEDRRGEGLVSHYRVGRRSILWTDPEIADLLDEWAGRSSAVEPVEFRSWATERGATFYGAGFDHLLPDDVVMPPGAPDVTRLDGTTPTTIAAVEQLHAECSADDVEAAEFEPHALDPVLVGAWRGGGLRALAGARPWDLRPGFSDIGVLVHPDARRSGLGRAAVAAVVDELRATDAPALYRCNVDNVGSVRLCRSLGFEVVTELEAFGFGAEH